MVILDLISTWSLVSSGLLPGSIMGPAECTVNISFGEVNILEGRATVQRELSRLQEWVSQKLIKFNNGTDWALKGRAWRWFRQWAILWRWLGSPSEHQAPVHLDSKKGSSVHEVCEQQNGPRLRLVIITLYLAIVRLHLNTATNLQSPNTGKMSTRRSLAEVNQNGQ